MSRRWRRVALANWIGAFALAVAVVCYLLAAFPGTAERAARIAAMGAGAYALAMPWLPPSTILTVRANAPLVGTSPVNATALGALAVVAGNGCTGVAALGGWTSARPCDSGCCSRSRWAWVAMGGFWFHFNLVPQSERYHLEFDLAFWLMAAIALAKVRVPRPGIVMAAVAILAFPVVRHEIRIARAHGGKAIDIHGTVEYQISRWLDEHMPGQRVFAPGTVSYWMNAFGDTPLLNGGFDNGDAQPHPAPRHVPALCRGEARRGARLADCLRLRRGGGAAEKGSREVYHPYSHPEKLRGLQELWRNGEDVIYAVPRGTKSLAHAVRAADLPQGRPEPYDTAFAQTIRGRPHGPCSAPGLFPLAGHERGGNHRQSAAGAPGLRAGDVDQRLDRPGERRIAPHVGGQDRPDRGGTPLQRAVYGGTALRRRRGSAGRAMRQRGGDGRRVIVDGVGNSMAKTFGFDQDELKLLLVAVRQMRRTFAKPRETDPSIDAYAALYDQLFEKLRDMAGPLPEDVEGAL